MIECNIEEVEKIIDAIKEAEKFEMRRQRNELLQANRKISAYEKREKFLRQAREQYLGCANMRSQEEIVDKVRDILCSYGDNAKFDDISMWGWSKWGALKALQWVLQLDYNVEDTKKSLFAWGKWYEKQHE